MPRLIPRIQFEFRTRIQTEKLESQNLQNSEKREL